MGAPMITPRQARTCAGLLVATASVVVANVAFLQSGHRTQRAAPVVTLSMATPQPVAPKLPSIGDGRALERVQRSLATSIRAITTGPARADTAVQQQAGLPNRLGGFAMSGQNLIDARVAADVARKRTTLVQEIQRLLTTRGYAPGPANGHLGLVTRSAILAFEHDQGLSLTAEPGQTLRHWLRPAAAGPRPAPPRRSHRSAATVSGVVLEIQRLLIASRHLAGAADGRADERTVAAIRAFEMAHDLVPSGRISGPLATALLGPSAKRPRLAKGG